MQTPTKVSLGVQGKPLQRLSPAGESSTAAEKFVVQRKKEGYLQSLLNKAQETIDELKKVIAGLKDEIASLKKELSERKSIKGRLSAASVEAENQNLKDENQRLKDILKQYGIDFEYKPHISFREMNR